MKEMAIQAVNEPLSYDEIGERVFRGEVLQFSTPGGEPLIHAARDLCRTVFDTYDIEKAHELYSKKSFLSMVTQVQHDFSSQPRYKKMLAEWFSSIGIDTNADVYWETLGLRIAPPVQTHSGGQRSHTSVHRDTWGVAIQEQINWWAPIMPLVYKRTLAFYPYYWDQEIKNTTANWSYQEYMEAREIARKKGRTSSYPPMPKCNVPPLSPPHMVRPPCGDILAFSAAHLHSSVLNRTNRTRFSIEIRTVSASHIRRQCGALNVDSASHEPLYQLFSSINGSNTLLHDFIEEQRKAVG